MKRIIFILIILLMSSSAYSATITLTVNDDFIAAMTEVVDDYNARTGQSLTKLQYVKRLLLDQLKAFHIREYLEEAEAAKNAAILAEFDRLHELYE